MNFLVFLFPSGELDYCVVIVHVLVLNYRESEKSFTLDEDDYELLQESNITVPRRKSVSVVILVLFLYV